MRKVAIVTDSTAYIPLDLVQKHHITVLPQILVWGQETFQDGVDIQPDEFYSRLSKAKVMPTTSQVTIGTFKETFSRLAEEGYGILAILVGTKLSGKIDSAVKAYGMLPDTQIEIVDSCTTTMALGFAVLEAAKAAEEGADLRECRAVAERASEHVGVVFAVDTLEFLHRGGRIGGGTRFLGTALNLKPILEVTGGRVEAIERVRTRKKSLQRLIELAEDRIEGRQPVRLAVLHANVAEEAQALPSEGGNRLNAVETVFSQVSPVVGTHTGPGTLGLAWMAGM
jgi:DegV family protein with EDD domain